MKQFFILLAQSVGFWIVAFLFYAVFRFYGIGELENLLQTTPNDIPLELWINITLYIGLFLGISYAAVEFFFEKLVANTSSLGFTLALKTICYVLILVIVISFATVYVEDIMDIDLANDRGWWRTSKTFWATVLYFFISSLVFSFIKIANEKFGHGVFMKTLLGTYRKPKEENRVFMFLDLKDSTTIAELLGHYKYSQFIQDCFLDLNRVLRKYDAEVYQYVGDEAVLTWPYRKGVRNKNCVDLFFAFQEQLQRRSDYYNDKYEQVPLFKAGAHGGKLMVSEVGTVKKELAFHGDVINTTSRIQDKCNTYNETFLISGYLLEALQLNSTYIRNPLGSLALKGKQKSIEIFAININAVH